MFTTLKTATDSHGILTITLNRPDKFNALNATVLEELSQCFETAKADPKVKALLLTGEGKAFCAGADIEGLAELTAETGQPFARAGQAVIRQLETLGKPSLAAVNGFAFGGGCELAMGAHIRIASSKAQFGQPEVKLGVIPGYGGTQRLARLVGKGRALDLCLTGRFIKADEALQWGLVTAVTEPDELLDKARETLQTVIAMAPIAIQQVVDVIDQGYDMPLEQALALEAESFAKTCATEDKVEGTRAFLEKREASFMGK
ncbi:MAG: enoyl-CoA hydratase [Legionellales bacterium]|nr:enoyl-CoA hydratase [Legionellales bacterium]|tara:strand:- start:16095 stop:16874 length:780 start_codon:yes stop_codon:yes gene_type:complete